MRHLVMPARRPLLPELFALLGFLGYLRFEKGPGLLLFDGSNLLTLQFADTGVARLRAFKQLRYGVTLT